MNQSSKISLYVYLALFTILGILISLLSYLTALFILLYLLLTYLLYKERSFFTRLRILTFSYSIFVVFASALFQAFL
jgi:hypothetical protein